MDAVRNVDFACHVERDTIAPTATNRRDPVVCFVGRPNVGKSTFFAYATGRFAETANMPGTTVGTHARDAMVDGRRATLVDLPGTFTLTDQSDGLPPFWQLLAAVRPDAIVVVIDAGDLARHLPLALACRDLGVPFVVAANLADEAEASGIHIDRGRLSQLLGAPVYRTIGRRGEGVAAAVGDAVRAGAASIAATGRSPRRPQPALPYRPASVLSVARLAREGHDALPGAGWLSPAGSATIDAAAALAPERSEVAQRWTDEVESQAGRGPTRAQRLARAITSPWPGLAIFVAVVVAALGLTIVVGTFLAGILASVWQGAVTPPLTAAVQAIVPNAAIAAALLWALDSGLLAMLSVGIPFVMTFYIALAILEDSGYLASTAVLSDRIFNAFGLPGRAAIPVLASTGCNVPAIYGTRVLESRRERILASFLSVMTPCSARSAVVVAALAPFAGPVAALAAFGVVALVAIVAGIGANAIMPSRQSPLVLELPRLRWPIARQVWLKAWFRFRSFLRTAAPVMLFGSLLLGLAYESGAIALVEPVVGPFFETVLGLPAVAGIALGLAFLRKELALQLLIVLAVAKMGADAARLDNFLSSGQLFVFAIVTAVSVPCVATVAALADELGWRATAGIAAATVAIGLLAGAIVARLVGVA